MAIDFGIESVLTSLLLLHSQTQEDLDVSMMATKQGVSMMHELYTIQACMHDARAMQQVASIRSNIQVGHSIHPSNLIPPIHVFNGEFLFLRFLV